MNNNAALRPDNPTPVLVDPSGFQALREVVLRPDAFFASLPRTGVARAPALFALTCIALSTVLAWLATGTSDSAVEGLAIPFVFDLVLFAVYLGVTHAVVRLLLRGQSAGLPATFRILAYGQVGQLVNWLPTVGLAIGLVYASVLAVIGIRRMHDASLAVAVAVVALPLVSAGCAAAAYFVIAG